MPSVLRRPSTLLFAALCAALVAIKLLFQGWTGAFPIRGQAEAFTWPLVLGVIGIGLAGLFADRSARLPDPLSDRRREASGAAWAAASGAVYGLVTIASDLWRPDRHVLSAGTGWDHVALPWSIPFYGFGAIFLEFLLRLGALVIGFWLIHVVLLRRRARLAVFWVLAVVVSAYEIWPYVAQDIAAKRWTEVALAVVQPLYLSNLFEAWLLLRYGWFAPIVFRLAFYLVWHILYGGLAGPP